MIIFPFNGLKVRLVIPYPNCLSHFLFDDVNVIVVETKIADAILNKSTSSRQDVRLVSLQHFLHQTLRNFVLRAGNTLLKDIEEKYSLILLY